MAGEYEIILSTPTTSGECVIGENIKANPGYTYMVANYESNEICGVYNDVLCSDNYSEILQLYGERIVEASKEFAKKYEMLKSKLGDISPISKSHCEPVSYEDSILNKVAVISPSCLKRGLVNSANQLVLVTGGFGANSNSRGRKVFVTNIASGEKETWCREDIMGTINNDNLPLWAQNRLQQITAEFDDMEI